MPAEAADWWGSYYVDTGLTEDRYIKAIESKPGQDRRRASPADVRRRRRRDAATATATTAAREAGEFLNEFAVGKNGDLFPEGTGRLLKAGSKIKFDFHYHSVGKEIDRPVAARHRALSEGLHAEARRLLEAAGTADRAARHSRRIDWVRSDGYTRFNKPGRITAFQPHMHTRGKRQCIELIYPDNKTEQINCADWSFNWHIVDVYADDVAPIYPAGTVLHVISWHDNSAGKGNPDPRNWVGSGQRTIDEMGFAWITWYDFTDEEYQAEFDARKSAAKRTTTTRRTASMNRCGFGLGRDYAELGGLRWRALAVAPLAARSRSRPSFTSGSGPDSRSSRSTKDGSACPTAASTWCSGT